MDPDIVELDVHGTNGMEDGNDVEDYGIQESGIRDNHLEGNGMQEKKKRTTTWGATAWRTTVQLIPPYTIILRRTSV
jgi:hypothetical protein